MRAAGQFRECSFRDVIFGRSESACRYDDIVRLQFIVERSDYRIVIIPERFHVSNLYSQEVQRLGYL